MTERERSTTVGRLPNPTNDGSRVPALLTRLVWLLWIVSLGVLAVLAVRFRIGEPWDLAGVVNIDGLTVVM
jgi:NAD(P)H-quinone oxidoreductase subunit 5